MYTLTKNDENRVLRAAYPLMLQDLRRSLYAITRDIVKLMWKVDVGEESKLADLAPDLQVLVCDVLAVVASLRDVALDDNISPDDFKAEAAEKERAGWRCSECRRTLDQTDDVVRIQIGRADRPKSFKHFREFGNICWTCFRDAYKAHAFFMRRLHREAKMGDKATRAVVLAVRRRRAQRSK